MKSQRSLTETSNYVFLKCCFKKRKSRVFLDFQKKNIKYVGLFSNYDRDLDDQ